MSSCISLIFVWDVSLDKYEFNVPTSSQASKVRSRSSCKANRSHSLRRHLFPLFPYLFVQMCDDSFAQPSNQCMFQKMLQKRTYQALANPKLPHIFLTITLSPLSKGTSNHIPRYNKDLDPYFRKYMLRVTHHFPFL